jgi:hypothetical protein
VLLADGGITLVLIGGLFLIGAALVTALRALFRAIAWVFGLGCDRRTDARASDPAAPARICSHPRCGHANRGDARYCARCGTALDPSTDVDRYG